MRNRWIAGLPVLLLAGCAAATGGWVKAGAQDPAVAEAYSECRDLAATAVKTEADIDQDIIATRQNDWSRSSIGRVQSQTLRDQTRDRAASITASCMQSKGFTPPR